MENLDLPKPIPPPTWSLQVGDFGRYCVIGAAILFVIAALAWVFGARNASAQKIGRWGFALGCIALFGTFASLAVLFLANRFEFAYVWGHSDTRNAIPYRLAGIWSGQQGSFLLWGVCAAVFALLVKRRLGTLERWYTVSFSVFLGSIAGILAYESPFLLNLVDGQPIVPVDGVGLAPSLQNYWVTIHPPTIFMGFGSLTALFALAFAALMTRDYDAWIPIVRPWAIVSTTLVGIGLCMGGFWAYETLGWGGFWMWDPVENVSFVPWVFTAAFIHGIIVQVTRGTWKIANLLLGGLPFLAFLFGTFLTRSGFLADASVHSFAEMDRSALRLLVGLMGVTTVGFIGLWTVRAFQMRKAVEPRPTAPGVTREGFYLAGSLFLIALGVATLIGMSVPLIMALQGNKPAVVEERIYHMVVPYMFVPIMVLMAIAPFVSWRAMGMRTLLNRVYSVVCITIGLLGLVFIGFLMAPWQKIADIHPTVSFPTGKIDGLYWVLALIGICLFAIVANSWRMVELKRASKLSWGPFVTHVGVAVLLAGLIVSRAFERREVASVMEDHPGRALGYIVRYAGQTSDSTDRENKVLLEILNPKSPQRPLYTAKPGLYFVPGPDGGSNPMVWPHIQHYGLYDLYLTVQPPQTDTGRRLTLKPGETQEFGGLNVTFVKLERQGEAGMAGTKFGARLKISNGRASKEIVPQLELGSGGGPVSHPAMIDSGFEAFLEGMDVATGSVTVGVQFKKPIYWVELFSKPLTGLVWLGAGIMTFGGLLAAIYRRRRLGAGAATLPETVETKGEDREPLHV